MFKNISSTLLVMVITMLSSFVVTIILGQTLSFNDFGEFVKNKIVTIIKNGKIDTKFKAMMNLIKFREKQNQYREEKQFKQ